MIDMNEYRINWSAEVKEIVGLICFFKLLFAKSVSCEGIKRATHELLIMDPLGENTSFQDICFHSEA